MVISDNQEQLDTPPDQSQIIFVRVHRGFGGVPVFDITNGDPQLIGILSRFNKLAYFVEPGKHTFMVIAMFANFMEANVVGGKTYYVYACPGGVWWETNWHLYPMRNEPGRLCRQTPSEALQKWSAKAVFVENTEESVSWAKANRDSIIKKQTKGWERWEAKSDEHIGERTLNEADGN
jgi:hypothetical protein